MRATLFALAAAAACAASTLPAHADVFLGRTVFDRDIGILGQYPTLTHSVYLAPVGASFTGEGTLFEDIVLSDGDIRIDEITLADDPDFAALAFRLTDGLDWFFHDRLTHQGANVLAAFGPESVRVPRPGLPGPDLAGWTITRVVRLVEAHIAVPGSDPNGDGNWTSFQLRAETRFYGVPGSGALAAFGAGAAVGASRRRRAA
jgi:hypothetical protein